MFIYVVTCEKYWAVVIACNVASAHEYYRDRHGQWANIQQTNKLGVVTADVSDQYVPGVHKSWLR